MTDQSYDIEVERDEFGVTRRVWLTRASDGTLSLAGHDMGGAVSEFWGDDFDEYEWSWTLGPARVPALFEAFDVDAPPADATLEMAVKLRAIGTQAAQTQFENAGAEFWSRLGD
jgi:hypothetical protein